MRDTNLRIKLRKIGSGQGLLLSKDICRLLGINVGDRILVDLNEDGLVLKPEPGKKEL